MNNPIFWLGLSFTLVAASLTAVLIALIPMAQELSKAARSAEKLFDTLNKEFPDTLESIKATNFEITELSGEIKPLESIKATNFEITELSGEIKQGVKSATSATKQIDGNITEAKKQVKNAQVKSRSLWAGLKAGVKTWQNYPNQSLLKKDVD